jgi:hypothetical protein
MSKRVADKQITKDNQDHSGSGSEPDLTVAREKASEDVIATRKIVSVRRGAAKPVATEAAKGQTSPKSPKKETGGLFAGLVGLGTAASKADEKSPKQTLFAGLGVPSEKEKGDKSPKGLFGAAAPSEPSTGGLFSTLFTDATAGEGLFSSSQFTFAPAEGGLFGAPAGGEAGPAFPSFGESPEASEGEEEEQEPELPAVAQSDELEGEEQIYQSDCKLFKLYKEEEESEKIKWVEKCIGFVRLSKKRESGAIRLIVRMKAVFRLVLNIALVEKICRAEKVGNKSVRFNGIDEDGSLGMYRVNLLTEDQQTVFLNLLPENLKQ